MRKYEFRYLYRPSTLHIHANSFSSQCKKGGKGLNSIHSRVAQMQNFVLKQAAFLSWSPETQIAKPRKHKYHELIPVRSREVDPETW